ncbi:MAG: AAA family ATPase [Burkholderiales bacterium]|nr:AAA family ATPase [Burkholderiales bacterium]
MNALTPLPPEELAHRCDARQFAFATTDELEDIGVIPGQERATDAIELAIGIEREGYNLFVMGSAGCGRHTLVRQRIEARAKGAPRPSDWVYVNNFVQPQHPIAIELPSGRGAGLSTDMVRLVEELRSNIPAVFEGDEYRSKADSIDAEFKERHEKAFAALGDEAVGQGVALLRTPAGFSFAPVKDGEVMGADEFGKLPEADQERVKAAIEALQTKLERLIRDTMRWRKERLERIRELNREMTLYAVGHLVDELKQRYASWPRVVEYLDAVQHDVIENADDFRKPDEEPSPIARLMQQEEPSLRRYQVNVVVDNGKPDGLPVVYADHPTLQNLVGRIDHISRLGTLVTDFGLIRPGALHRANGGYLLVDAIRLLTQPFAWEGLKRALLRHQIRIESLGEVYGLVSTLSLEPEPIPLNVKVVLVGERLLFYLLQAYDPDFGKLFRVAADFEEHLERTPETSLLFARFIATRARSDKLLPLERDAVARALDYGSRAAGDTHKITANLERLVELLHEADHRARNAGSTAIGAAAIAGAIDAQRHRAGRLRAQVQEAILRGKVLIDTAGGAVGQVNGLSVFDLGDFAFAEPVRITATTRLGEGQVIDIQREVELGGAIHSKGVMILSSFLAARFSGNLPHSLAASLVFEQTYGHVDGDSASLAELCALLSSLADAPIRQGFAVTGSINQLGEVQPIGAVNEKIEGFFDICQARGLTGEQGVLIPAANVDQLMLRDEVVAAAADGKFRVFAVRSVDEAIELLTGLPAGLPQDANVGAQSTLNGRVAARLRDLAALRREQPRPGQIKRVARSRAKHDAH